jgi:LysR family glycine cleavage system transcriptional activator
LADSFNGIAYAVDAMRSNVSEMVTIGATIAFSSFWLLPRLPDFRRTHPGIQIRVISQDSNFSLNSGEVDIALRFGSPPFSDGTVIASRRDIMFPVCAPEYANSHNLDSFPDGRFDLIETDVPIRNWYRWADWFERIGRRADSIDPALRFSYFTETIAATRAGQGIALGWETLIQSHLEDGSLIRIGSIEVEPEGYHNVVVPPRTKRSAAMDLVAGWLTQALQRP